MSVLTDARPKLAQRSSQRRRKLVRRLLPWVGAVVVLTGAAWVVLVSTLLGVHHVEIVGADRVSAAEVLAAAQVPDGRPLARLDTGSIAARVRTLAPVADVQVRRHWPTTVQVVITERTPFAVVRIADVAWFVDRSGKPFDRRGAATSTLPQLTTAHPGADDPATRAGLDVLAALPPKVLAMVDRIDVPGPEQVTLQLAGKTVIWGSAEHTAAKAATLAALLKQDGTHYDISTPGVVTVR